LKVTQQPLFAPGSIRKRFESEPGRSVEELSAENERNILSFKEPQSETEEEALAKIDETMWCLSHKYKTKRWSEDDCDGSMWYPQSSIAKNDLTVEAQDDATNYQGESARP